MTAKVKEEQYGTLEIFNWVVISYGNHINWVATYIRNVDFKKF